MISAPREQNIVHHSFDFVLSLFRAGQTAAWRKGWLRRPRTFSWRSGSSFRYRDSSCPTFISLVTKIWSVDRKRPYGGGGGGGRFSSAPKRSFRGDEFRPPQPGEIYLRFLVRSKVSFGSPVQSDKLNILL